MKFGTSLSLRRWVEDEVKDINMASPNQAIKVLKEVENEKSKEKKRTKKKKSDVE